MDDSDTSGRSAGGLFDSLRALLATLVAMAHTRVELFGTEIEEEVRRVVALLLGGLAVLTLASLALLFSGLVVIAAYWDTHRMAATVGVTKGSTASIYASGTGLTGSDSRAVVRPYRSPDTA